MHDKENHSNRSTDTHLRCYYTKNKEKRKKIIFMKCQNKASKFFMPLSPKLYGSVVTEGTCCTGGRGSIPGLAIKRLNTINVFGSLISSTVTGVPCSLHIFVRPLTLVREKSNLFA